MLYHLGMTALDTFAKRVRLMRNESEMSQEDLVAAMADEGVIVSQGHWSRIERGKVIPSANLVMAAAKALGVSADYLLCLSEEARPRESADTIGISSEAEDMAALVDSMSPARRQDIVRIAESLARAEQESRTVDRERAMLLLQLIRRTAGDVAYRQALDILSGTVD